jgi:hypothetical protein
MNQLRHRCHVPTRTSNRVASAAVAASTGGVAVAIRRVKPGPSDGLGPSLFARLGAP